MKKIVAYLAIGALALQLLVGQAHAQDVTAKVSEVWTSQGRIANITAGTSSAAVALPAAGFVAYLCNGGSVDAYVAFGSSTVVVTVAAGSKLAASQCAAYDLRPFGTNFTHVATITGSSTASIYVETGQGTPPAVPPSGSSGSTSVTQGTTPWVSSITAWGGTTLGAGSNYGTSPGAVAVPGVNAFVTNPVAVTGTFWQATQPVSGTFFQATQPVSNAGTFAVQATLGAETTKVIGTVNQGTSPWVVSAASLPLPTGAATETSVASTATNTGTANTNLGAPGATACATDTGSCSLNALLQRQLQRLTTMIAALGSPFQAGGPVGLAAPTTGGCTPGVILTAANNNSTAIKAGAAGILCELTVINTTVTLVDVRLYDSAAAPTCSSATGVVANYPVQGNTVSPGFALPLGAYGKQFTNGIGICVTGANANNDNTNAVTGINVNYAYK